MNEWEWVACVLAAGVALCAAAALLFGIADALIALELAGTLASTALVALSEGLQRQPFVDLGVTLAVLSLVGAFVIARMLEEDP
jgi:multisubunit Na+/H+ antiporter MnhF subunit